MTYISGVLVNDSKESFTGVTVHWHLHAADDSMVGDAFDFVQMLPPAGRWRFSAIVNFTAMAVTPAYAQGGTISTMTPRYDVSVASDKIWDPIVWKRIQKAEAKRRKKAAKDTNKAN